ncbi:MAG: hypothetical protein UU95_C0040G0006, partial [Parcubacteria group bacterium GW2011_GWC2_42_12]
YLTATSTTATSTFAGGLSVGNNAALVVNQAATANSLYITTAGNVGIGTTTPNSILSLYQAAADTALTFGNSTATMWTMGTDYSDGSKFKIASSSALGTNDRLTIDTTGNVGIGTTSPGTLLSLGNTGANTINISATATSTFGSGIDLRTGCFAVNGVCVGGGGAGVSGGAANTVAFWTGATSLSNNSLFAWDNTNTRLGIGTSTPYAKLSVVGPVVAEYFHATSTTATSTFAGGMNIGSGALVYDYSSAITSIGALETGNLNFETDAGAVSWVDLPLSAATAGTVESYTAYLAGTSTLTIYGTANGSGGLASGPFVGIGTTSPYSKLAVVDETTALRDVFTVSTSTSGLIFKVDSYGRTYADGAYSGAGADYAEYFYTADIDLKSGETVCIDLIEPNAVKKCQRGHDNNVMGIVSTKPSIVGNNSVAVRNDPAHYAMIGLLGQVDAFVSAENGVIKVGDSLTSASSTPGYAMRADGGDSTVGVALEPLKAGQGKIKVLISRRNKSLAVEEVEQLVVERVAEMKIEDEVQRLIADAVSNLNLDPKIQKIAQEEAGKLDVALTIKLDGVNGVISSLDNQILALRSATLQNNNSIAGINNELLSLRSAWLQRDNLLASTTALVENIKIERGDEGGLVQIIDPTEISASSTQTAFVVNQQGGGDVADFQTNGVSVMNIADSGEVKIMGSLLVDGRIMLCSGGHCSNALDAAVDETRADLGVEGKVVAGAFEGYCGEGLVWAPGSAKYGTLPGFCVMNDLAAGDGLNPPTPFVKGGINMVWTGVSQGQAQVACQTLGAGYHLIGENEWLTIAENILQVAENDTDAVTPGMQLASTSSAPGASTTPFNKGGAGGFKLTNDNVINNLAGRVAEWTNQNITSAGLPVTPSADDWFEYSAVSDFKGLNIAPDYYLTDQTNNIGKIFVGSGNGLRGFVRGWGGIYGLDLSHSPAEQSVEIGFRCAK